MNGKANGNGNEKKERIRQLCRTISNMTDAEKAQFIGRLPFMATVEGRVLSPFNTCLIGRQLPTASILGGFQQWKRAGRSVKKGEHALSIWCPSSKKTDDDNEKTYFFLGNVFDVSQTEEVASK